jgi:formylglycine-generating enzyme required for sulfatase activity
MSASLAERAARALLKPGDHIGEWIVESALGEGGMGAVYRVHSALSERLVAAIKILKPTGDADVRTRFVREAEALSALRHPSIVRVMGFAVDIAREVPYIVMELAEGETLKARLQRGALGLEEAVGIFLPLAAALAHAHDHGIAHRDVKPANIVLVNEGGVRLVDFGIAAGQDWESLTTGGHLGTLSYLPPEVFRAEKPDPRAIDVYGFGLLLHEALAGTPVFPVEPGLTPPAAAASVAARKLNAGPLEPGPGFPDAVRDAVRRATDPDPARRPSMGSLRDALIAVLPARASRRRTDQAATQPYRPGAPALPGLGQEPTTRVPDPPRRVHDEAPQAVRRAGFVAAVAAAALVAFVLSWMVVRRSALRPRPVSPAAAAAAPAGAASPRAEAGRDGLEYALAPAGTYRMGCTPGDDQCDPARFPPAEVSIPRPFWIGRTEVTVAAYRRFAAETGRPLSPAPSFNRGWSKPAHPVVNVSWHDAAAYCAWAGGRLPTEEEWEYAARGGHPDWFHPWGNEAPSCEDGVGNGARFGGECGRGTVQGTAPVAAYEPNGFGLFDMAGNVWEWCAEPWQPGGVPAAGAASAAGGHRVLRGGSWVHGARFLRVSVRSSWPQDKGAAYVGFRCVREASPG